MASLLRPTGAAVVAALLMAGAASATTPALSVTSTRGVVTIATRQSTSVYRTTVLVPAAYALHTRVHVAGTATLHASTALGPLTFTGWIAKADPAGFVADDCAADMGYRHLAVWQLELRQVNGLGRVEVPVYVDAGPAGTTALTWCAATAADMPVTGVTIAVDPVISPPVTHGAFTWRALFDDGSTHQAEAVVHD